MTQYETEFQNHSKILGYETELPYLRYDYTGNKIGIPKRLQERHLTEETGTAHIQAIGWGIQIYIPSPRDSISIRFDTDEQRFSDSYGLSFGEKNEGHISVGRFEDELESYGKSIPASVECVSRNPEIEMYEGNKITYDMAERAVVRYLKKNRRRRSQVSSKHVAKSAEIEPNRHNLYRLNAALDERLEAVESRSSRPKRYKIQ